MPTSIADHSRTAPVSLTGLLRAARHQQRLSQLDLSLALGISTRHLGFVEVGRSRPSRQLLLRWLEHLQVPLGTRNQALCLAGYAPAYDESPLASQELDEARAALAHLLDSHDPFPAVVIDSDWAIQATNSGFRRLVHACGSTLDLPAEVGQFTTERVTLIDLVLAPDGIGAALINLMDVAPAFLTHLRHDALTNPRLDVVIEQVEALLPPRQPPVKFPPALITRYATTEGELSFLSMFTTFGTPQSITLASLRVELMFPANSHTSRLMARHALNHAQR